MELCAFAMTDLSLEGLPGVCPGYPQPDVKAAKKKKKEN